ncbi:BPHL [Symbiodinium sp. CCMP2592]|nr:BPHL [Symbiodinium sp. CCMP2592]
MTQSWLTECHCVRHAEELQCSPKGCGGAQPNDVDNAATDEVISVNSSVKMGQILSENANLGLAQMMSPQRLLRLSSGDLEHKMSDIVASGHLGHFEIDNSLLRGVSVCSTLQGLGWVWRLCQRNMTDETWSKLERKSRPVREYDLFISHTWRTSGSEKLLSLLLSTGWSLSLLLWTLALLIAVCIQLWTDLLPAPFSHEVQVMNFSSRCPLSPWATAAGMLTQVLSSIAIPYAPTAKGARICFLDVACIHQRDPELKERGIYSIGGFLKKAKELHVLWTPSYLHRLWCVFELAAYRVANPSGKITLSPVFMEQSILLCAAVLWCSAWCYFTAMASGLSFLGIFKSELLPLGISTLPLGILIHRLRRLFHAKRQMFAELQHFQLGSAECTEVFDYLFVHSAINTWYGSDEEFERFVQGPLFQELSERFSTTGDVPFAYCVLLATAPISVTIDETISLWLGGAPLPVVLSSLIGHVYGLCFCWFLVCIRLLYHLCDRFAIGPGGSTQQYLQTILIYFSFCACYLAGSFVGEVAYRHSLEAASVHAGCCSVAAVVAFRWPWLLRVVVARLSQRNNPES